MKEVRGVIIGSALVTGLTLLYLWHRYRKRLSETEWKEVAEVDKLFVHPVKSCRGIEVESFVAQCKGIYTNGTKIGDRSFMMTHENGRFATIRQFPKMVLITPTVVAENKLVLNAPGMDPIEVATPDHRSVKANSYKVFGTPCLGIDCGDEVAKWLQTYTKANNTRLVHHSERLPSRKNPMLLEFSHLGVYAKEPLQSMFHDDSPFNLVSQASLDMLNTKLDENHQINERFFRSNVLLKGCDAFAEDSWKRIRIGSAEFRFAKHCTRCKVTTVNPATGVMDVDRNTLTSLSSFRLCKPEEKPLYGESPKMSVDFVVTRPGKVSSGDKVYVYTGDN